VSECGQDVNVELEDVITNPFPTLPAIPPSTGVGEVIGIGDWPTTGLIGITPGIQVPTLSSYRPQIGDLAYLIKQGSQWIAIGSLSTRGIGGALPTDGVAADGSQARWSFENGAPGTAIGQGWSIDTSSSVSATVDPMEFANSVSSDTTPIPHGVQVAKGDYVITALSSGAAASYFMLSPSVPCSPGQSWQVSMFVRQAIFQGSPGAYVNTELIFNSTGQPSPFEGASTSFGSSSSGWVPMTTGPMSVPPGNSSFRVTVNYGSLASNSPVNVTGSFLVDDVRVWRVS